MNRFLEHYSICPNAFRDILRESGALLSGSAALAMYLEQEGVDAGYEPGDMDIWIIGRKWENGWMFPWTGFLIQAGYAVTETFRELDVYMERLTRIQRVITFEQRDSGSGSNSRNKIQIIVVDVQDLKGFVVNDFDFSACMTWWSTDSERFETVYPALTLQKKLFVQRKTISQGNVARMEERLEKYRSRGFEVVEEPPPYWIAPDARAEENIAVWSGTQGFDVWEYEEKDIAEHLRQSEWNIVVGCSGSGSSGSGSSGSSGSGSSGSSWWLFDRRTLIQYMESHRILNQHGGFYDTPYRQTVSHEAWDSLAYSDYSVYVLVGGQERMVRGVIKTVYEMEAYSVEGWRLGSPLERFDRLSPLSLANDIDEGDEEEGDEEEGDRDDDLVQRILADMNEPLEPLVAPVEAIEAVRVDEELYQEMLEWIRME